MAKVNGKLIQGPKALKMAYQAMMALGTFFFIWDYFPFWVDMTDNGHNYYQKKVPRQNPARFPYMATSFHAIFLG